MKRVLAPRVSLFSSRIKGDDVHDARARTVCFSLRKFSQKKTGEIKSSDELKSADDNFAFPP